MTTNVRRPGSPSVHRAASQCAAWTMLALLTACGGGDGGEADPTPANQQLSVAVTGNGTVTSSAGNINCGSACTATLPANSSVSLVATPAAGQVFQSWGGACSATTGTTCTIAVTQATSVSATFAPASGGNTFALSVAVTGSGTVSSQPAGIDCGATCTANFAANATVTLSATPGQGQVLQSWGGACSGTATCSVTMGAARNVTAIFVQAPAASFPLTVTVTGSGAVRSQPAGIDCGTTCSANFTADATVGLTATPAQGQVLQSWGGACSGNAACSVTLSAARAVTATFTAATTAGWSGPQLLENNNDFNVAGTSLFADVSALAAIDADGNALVIWEQSDGTPDGNTEKVYSRRYVPGQGWATAVEVPGASGANQQLVTGHLLVDGAGNFTWVRHDFAARRYSPQTGWSTVAISPSSGVGQVADATIDASGNVHVLRTGDGNVWHATLSPTGTQWSAWANVANATGAVTGGGRIAVSGNAGLAIWRERNPGDSNDSMWANRMVNNVWQTRVRIEELLTDVGNAAPALAMDAAGNALAAWNQADSLYVARFDVATTAWGTPQQFDAGQVGSLSNAGIGLAMHTDGRAVVAWSSGLSIMKAVTFSAATGFSTPASVATSSIDRTLRMDGQGNLTVVHRAGTAGAAVLDVYAHELPAGGGWSSGVLLETAAGEIKGNIPFAMNAAGQAVAVWAQDDLAGSRVRNSLWSNLRR